MKYTIKDGIVYDAKQLLADVAAMVEKQKRAPRTSPAQQQRALLLGTIRIRPSARVCRSTC